MMKKILIYLLFPIIVLFSGLLITSNNVVNAQINQDPNAQPDAGSGDAPRHLEVLEGTFVNGLIAAWGLSILYFLYRVVSIGAQYMFSFDDSNKKAELKSQGGSIIVAMVIVFGSYIFVRTIMLVLSLKTSGPCGLSITDPTFQFFFPEACNG